ncbi:PAS domain S-box protein [Rufibacter hautae]|uniref:histidine kinase n=1 Tax=Rufibacter hautae TaxID=2595005 RepID=A0A5B6TL24_9BACT|nr:PAS domain S-box protein [Rufibacter hautae]KAA3440095.1 PAS domain S-box protein [Rufibacter hautae]
MQEETQDGSAAFVRKGTQEGKDEDDLPAANQDETMNQIQGSLQEPANHQEQLALLQQELEATRQELEKAKNQARQAASEQINVGLLKEVSAYKKTMELERLGKKVLERNALPGSTLESTVSFYLKEVEKMHKGMFCSCMRLKGDKLYPIAAPSLPESFCHDIKGIQIGENAGSCGTAAFLGQKVIAMDVKTDPRWKDYYPTLLNYGLEACWSFPLIGSNQKILGTMAIYYQEVKAPTPEEEETLESIRSLLQLILENKLSEIELRESNDRYYYATLATKDAIWDFDIINYRINWGPGFEKLFGFKVKEFGPELDVWAAQVHPEDLERVNGSLDAAIASTTQGFWREEYRFKKANGEYAYVIDQGTVLRDENGRSVRIVGAMLDVTEQKETEEKLRKLSVVARETINGVLIMSPDLTIQWVNAAFTRMMGYTQEEMFRKTPGTLMNGPETDVETLEFIDSQLKELKPLQCEIIQYSKDREKRWIKLQVQPLLDEKGKVENVFALLTDITQQKAEEQQLRLLESVITNAKDAIILSEVTLGIPQKLESIFYNEAFFKLTGYTPEEVLGRDPAFLTGPETDATVLQNLTARAQAGLSSEVELVSYRKDGSTFWSHLLLIPMFNRKQQLTHWISMLRDITNRKHYEQEREVLIGELTQNNADLKQFTFITSHNLRAPLANLTGIANLIDTESIPEGRNKVLIQKFKESTVQLNTIIDDLLEVLVIKDNPHTNKEQVNLAQAFEKVVISVDGLLDKKDIQLTTDFSQVPEVYYNAGYLHSILLNLLTNAVKYRSPNRPLHIDVKAEKADGCEKLYFSDNGLGIDLKRYGERIFGLYQRFHHHKDSKGMGLYIAHSQAKAMGGNLSVTSEVDKGSTFILEF